MEIEPADDDKSSDKNENLLETIPEDNMHNFFGNNKSGGDGFD